MQKKYKAASIIITHDMVCAKLTSDRVIVLNEGLSTEIGTFNDLKSSKQEIVKEYLDVDSL